MTDKELQKMKRIELLEMLVEQSKQVETLEERVKELEAQLKNREIMLDKAGDIAEASLMLNGVFDAAQAAAHQYLDNIRNLSERQEAVCEAMEQKTREKCEAMEKETEEKCLAMQEDAKRGVEEKWSELSSRLENFYDMHKGLREILAMTGSILGAQSVKNEEKSNG